MQTKHIIQTQANVIKVTNLTKGNVLKMIDNSAYGDDKVKYAIVTDMLNDGEQTFIEMLVYTKSYNEVKSDIKLYKGTEDLAIFPTTTEEVEEYFMSAIAGVQKEINETKEKLGKLQHGIEKAKEFTSGELEKKLTLAGFETSTQDEFNEQKAIKEAKIKELEGDE